ncbi:MAG: DNA-binding domain-containing protein [bacterium]|nr:DNA-binding domain-containing protein [bacterium]
MPEKSIKDSPKPPSDLVELQNWFSGAVTAPESEKERLFQESKQYVTASSKQDTFQRVEVYMTDFWPRITESMGDDFEHVKTHCGDDAFNALIKDYIAIHPSTSFTLYHVGQSFPSYLESYYHGADRAKLIDMAHFDWAKCAAFMAQNRPHLDPSTLPTNEQQRIMDRPIKCHPSVSILELLHTPPAFSAKSTTTWWVIYRKEFQVHWKSIPASFATLLHQIQDGGTLIEIVTRLQNDANHSLRIELEQHIQTYFQTAVTEQWLITN